MASTRQQTVAIAKSYLGAKQGSAQHRKLVQIFNSVKPSGEVMNNSAAWCACAWSAWQIQAGNRNIAPLDYNCGNLIAKAKKMGIWVENDAFVPTIGDGIIYNWNDSGRGDCTSGASHVGMVVSVGSGKIVVIEGNYSTTRSCQYRTIKINSRYIRGFICPKYPGSSSTPASSSSSPVTVDGDWGCETTKATQKLLGTGQDGIVSNQLAKYKKFFPNTNPKSWQWSGKKSSGSAMIRALKKHIGANGDGWAANGTIKNLQRFLKNKGYYSGAIDGYMGVGTVKAWQKYLNSKLK